VHQSDQRNAILEALADAGEPLGADQIASACGMRPRNVRNMLARMRRDGSVTKAKRGKYALAA
jgi:DNA-binding IclR family transcriptional regulator